MSLSVARRLSSSAALRQTLRAPQAMRTPMGRSFASGALATKAPSGGLQTHQSSGNEPVLFFWDPGSLGLDGACGGFLAGLIIGSGLAVYTLDDKMDDHYEGFAWSGFQYDSKTLPPGMSHEHGHGHDHAHGHEEKKGPTKKAAAARDWAAGLPATRDLTSYDESMLVLKMATDMLASGTPLQELKDKYFGLKAGQTPGPTVVISAIGSAESKLMMKDLPNFHMSCVYAMFGEKNRIKQKAEHQNGQDFVRVKVKQLEWLFDGEAGKTWEVIAVDDGCPDNSKGLCRAIVEKEGYKNVRVLDLEDTVREQAPFFKERGLTAGCKQSRKGGAILYGLMEGSKSKKENSLVMYTDSDLSTDMSLCGLLADGILGKPKAAMSMGARYGMPGTFLVKPPDHGAASHPESHFEQPNMMKIVMRHWVRVRLLPMLQGIFDTQCAFKCFRAEDVMPIINEVKGIGADFDMELLLCGLSHYEGAGKSKSVKKTCEVYPTLFTEDFAESNFMATSDDPDKSFKTYATMTTGITKMHERYVAAGSDDAKKAAPVVAWAKALDWKAYKRMVEKLEADNGKTLIDHDFTLETIKAACA